MFGFNMLSANRRYGFLHRFWYFCFASWTYFRFRRRSLDLFDALLCKVYSFLALLDPLFSTFLLSLASLEGPQSSKQYKNQWFFNIFQHSQNRPEAVQSDLGTPKRPPQGAILFLRGPHVGLRGAPDKFFRSPHSPISRPGEGEQLPRSTETPTFAQTSHFKPTEKAQFYTGKTTVFEKFCFNTLSANRCNGFWDVVCVFFVFFVGSLTYF